MNKSDARDTARNLLEILIKNQPNLLVDKGSVQNAYGKEIANFCHDFIEQFAERLEQRSD
jgi:hypothetical protein